MLVEGYKQATALPESLPSSPHVIKIASQEKLRSSTCKISHRLLRSDKVVSALDDHDCCLSNRQ
jgi:hypothetical protein